MKIMKKSIFVLAVCCALSQAALSQEAEVVKLTDLQKYMKAPSEKVKVINFWATWCAPCVKELPLFEKLNEERQDVEVTLVSMDMDLDPNPEKVHKFIARKGIKSNVMILNEKDPNSWIDKIEKEWSGALPATIIINPSTGQRIFVEKQLHEGDLEALIEKLL